MEKELEIFIKAIGEPTRLQILHYLKRDCCVGEIWKKLNLPQNLTSHHLKVLKAAGLVTSDKRGLKVIYCLDKKNIKSCLKDLNNYLK